MSAKPDGGPAFPETNYYDDKPVGSVGGMSLRDYFAASVLQGLLASEANALLAAARRNAARERMVDYTQLLSQEAYAIADAMLAERAKP